MYIHCFYYNLYSHTSFMLVCACAVCVSPKPNDTELFAFGVYFSLLIDRQTCTAEKNRIKRPTKYIIYETKGTRTHAHTLTRQETIKFNFAEHKGKNSRFFLIWIWMVSFWVLRCVCQAFQCINCYDRKIYSFGTIKIKMVWTAVQVEWFETFLHARILFFDSFFA